MNKHTPYKKFFSKDSQLKERHGDFSKATERWFDDLYSISELHFEKNISQPELKTALKIAKKFGSYLSQGTKTKDFENFKKEVMKLKDGHFKRLQTFLKNLQPGDFDMDGVAKAHGYSDYQDYENSVDYDGEEEIREIHDKEFRHYSNDESGNSSVINSVLSQYSQGISYFGDLDEF